MILHLARDDKFIDDGFSIFERVRPESNELKIITETKEFVYIKTKKASTVSGRELLSNQFLKNLSNYEFVVIHWLGEIQIRLINRAPQNIIFVWIGWGGDYYDLIDRKILFPKTEQLSYELLRNRAIKSKVKELIFNMVKNFSPNIYSKKNALEKIDYFSPVLKEDYLLVNESSRSFHPKYIDWNYGSLEQLLGENILQINDNNIFLGNSASLENNHIEAIDMISTLDLENKKVISPLSYWYEKYRDAICEYGTEILGDSFVPLVDFLELEEYQKILSSCSVVVMNHIRQQALGNINIMMYYGAKIFLNKENPIYKFFKKNNAIIFSLEELSDEHLNARLSKEAVEINRTILKKHWSREVMIVKTEKLISQISGSR